MLTARITTKGYLTTNLEYAKMRKPFKGTVAYEWQVGRLVLQFCYNDKWNWREYGKVWRFNWFKT